MTDLQFKIAQPKDFYRGEGLEVETILMRGAVGLQALIGGSADYSSAAGSVIAAGVSEAIEFPKKSFGATKEVPPSQVFDFSFAEKSMGRIKN